MRYSKEPLLRETKEASSKIQMHSLQREEALQHHIDLNSFIDGERKEREPILFKLVQYYKTHKPMKIRRFIKQQSSYYLNYLKYIIIHFYIY